ncbi:SUMO1 sentrin specific peptidase 8 [Homalodisca vitripennis]|nr:SUMO1 sentrin specific peptidase 8 [Homalodisca vitripennis]
MSVSSLTYLERRREVCSGLSDGTASGTTAHLQGTAGATNIAALVVPLLTFVTPEPAVLHSAATLDKLVSNCDCDCNELINGASGVVLKFDDVCGQLNDVCSKYERLKEELDYLSAQRDVERNSHRSELNISLSNNDHLVNEKNTLEVKIKDIRKKLSKAENTNSLLRNLQAEHDNIVNDYETVQCANRKLIVENSRLKKLVEKNESICNVLKDKLLVNTNKIVQLESSLKVLNNKWLSDEIITDHIRLLNSEVTRIQNDILFVDPTLTQLLKLHSRTYVDQALSDMSFYNKSWVFFVLNNCDQGLEQNGGSHWSLLLLDNTTRTAVHYDSVRGLNERHAAALLVNLGLDSVPISEGQTFQQTESFECGVHVLVNARLLLGQVCDRFALTHNTLHHTDTSEMVVLMPLLYQVLKVVIILGQIWQMIKCGKL